MRISRRAKRMEKQHKRHRRMGVAALNLTALMDIFVHLVFFLLVNFGGIQPQGTVVVLPRSTVEKTPKDTLVITVSNQDIVVQGRRVADVGQVMASNDILIPGLQRELLYQGKRTSVTGAAAKDERPVTIMGDKEIPYKLLKRIMLTCSQTGYSQVSLAVTRTKAQVGTPS